MLGAGGVVVRGVPVGAPLVDVEADVDDAEKVILTLAAGDLPRNELLEWVSSHVERMPT